MFVKLFFCSYLLVNLFSFTWGGGDDKFDVVSTSQRPLDSLNTEQILTKIVEELKEEVSELKKRVKTLESQNAASSLKPKDVLTKLEESVKDEISIRLKTIELQNVASTLKSEQAIMKLEATLKDEVNSRLKTLELQDAKSALNLTELTNQYIVRLQALELQNAQNTLMLTRSLHRQREASHFKNCNEVKEKGYDVSSTYLIRPDFAPDSFRVLCEMDKNGGGWTYILRRVDGSQNFNLNWVDYRTGFGDFSGNFWLGLDNIHYLTGYKANELLVELVDWNNTQVYAQYASFSVGNEDESYSLKVLEGYSGTAGDSLSYHSNMKFTTQDKDQDLAPETNCASIYGGGWWFNKCKLCFLTGTYFNASEAETNGKGIHWDKFHGFLYSLKEVRMMVRSKEKK